LCRPIGCRVEGDPTWLDALPPLRELPGERTEFGSGHPRRPLVEERDVAHPRHGPVPHEELFPNKLVETPLQVLPSRVVVRPPESEAPLQEEQDPEEQRQNEEPIALGNSHSGGS